MRTMMDKYSSQLVIFYNIATLSSFTKAAQHLHCSKAHVSKQLSDLERSVGSLLFHRNTRSLKLTSTGEALFSHAQIIVNELHSAENTINALHSKVEGSLKVTSPQGYADYVLAPCLPQFLLQYPEVSLEMIHSGAYLNLVEEKIDIAIRITHEPPVDRVAKLLGYDQMVLCASKKYLGQEGTPKTPSKLLEHQCLVYSPQKSRNHWPFSDKKNLVTISVKPRISSNSIRILISSAINGLGIARLPRFAVQESINNEMLNVVLSDFDPPKIPIYAIFAQNRVISPKVQAFVKFMEQIHLDLE
jgi:DNA-binding transcriptional LysR family regulator